MGSGLTYFSIFFWSMLQYDHEKRSKKLTEHGVIRDKDLVVIPIAPPEGKKEPKDTTFDVEVDQFKQTCRALVSRTELGFLLAQFHFDEVLKSSKLEILVANDLKRLRELQTKEAALKVQERNAGSLNSDEASALKRVRKDKFEVKTLLDEYHEKLFAAYKDFVNVRSLKFDNLVSQNCLTSLPHEVEQVRYYKEAYHIDSAGVKGARFPEKDGEENDDSTPGSGWMFEYKWDWTKTKLDTQVGKTVESFKLCRQLHMRAELPEYGYAEAQYRYMMENISCPLEIEVKSMSEMIEQVSRLMYLLPSICDDPNPELRNKLTHIARKDKPFSETDMCQMLFYAMPVGVQDLWKTDHPTLRFPVDRPTAVKELQKHLDTFRKEKKKAREDANKGGQTTPTKRQGNGGGSNSRQGGGSRSSSGGERKKKMCDRCDQKGEKDRIKFSHWTDKCERYHADLKAKVPRQENQVHATDYEGDETQVSSARKRKEKKSKKRKKSKKSKRTKKKARRYYSSSEDDGDSSASSDSDSS